MKKNIYKERENTKAQMKKSVLEFCILSILSSRINLIVFLLICMMPLEASAQITNKNVYPPPSPPSLPAKGGKFIDPTFGTTVMRVTDQSNGDDNRHAYSYWSCHNFNSTRLYVQWVSGQPTLWDFDPVNFTLSNQRNAFPNNPGGLSTEDAIWSSFDPNIMYLHNGTKLYQYNVVNGTYTVLHDFLLNFQTISLAQMSVSSNDSLFAFTRKDLSSNKQGYIVWKKGSTNLFHNVSTTQLDEVQLDKTGKYLVVKTGVEGPGAIEVKIVNLQTKAVENLTDDGPDFAPGHSDNGTGMALGNDNWNNALRKRNLSNPHTHFEVINFGNDWRPDHMSMRADDESWVLVSKYNGDGTGVFHNEIFQVATDGSKNVYRLCHHHSGSTYWDSPKAAISKDGKFVTFTSSWGSSSRRDVFIVRVPPKSTCTAQVNVTASGPTTFCQGGNVILNAGSGYTSYLWSNGASTQTITVTQSGTYNVSVIDVNGCSATSSGIPVTMVSNPSPNIITNGSAIFCQGKSVTLSTGAYTSYKWSNGLTSSNIKVTQSGNYTVTVTDANGCKGTSQPVVITVRQDCELKALKTQAAVNIDGNLNDCSWNAAYSITFNNSSKSDNTTKLAALWDDNYLYFAFRISDVTIEKASTPIWEQDAIELYLDAGHNESITMDANDYQYLINAFDSIVYYQAAAGTQITHKATIGSNSYVVEMAIPWGQINTIPKGGTIMGLLPVNDDRDNGQSSTYDWLSLIESGSYKRPGLWGDLVLSDSVIGGNTQVPVLCMVTVSASAKNELVWEQLNGPVSYNIYKESTVIGVYNLISSVPSTQNSIYLDPNSNAGQKASNYKISSVNSCGKESALSPHHKTIHLTINTGPLGSWDLLWNHYEGVSYPTYYIFRGTLPGNLTVIDSISSASGSWSDLAPPTGMPLYYKVEIKHPKGCRPSTATMANKTISSNIANTIMSDIDSKLEQSLNIYPNPTNGMLIIECQEDIADMQIVLKNILGEELIMRENLIQSPHSLMLDLRHLSNGMYFLVIQTGSLKTMKSIIVKQ